MTATAAAGRPLLTLTTDFGTAGGHAGAIKGRVLSAVPEVTIVDISHDISPHDILEGAWCLRRAVPRFPPGSVHMAVVDPGVGGGRAGLIVRTERFLLLAPDNGLLSLIAREDKIRRIVAVREAPPEIRRSASFDGLTFFAPVAARLLAGTAPEALGEPVEEMVGLTSPEPRETENAVEGEVLFFDHFGNAITNITLAHLAGREALRVDLGGGGDARIGSHYGEAAPAPGRVVAIWNSDAQLELALHGGSLRGQGRIRVGEKVRLILKPGQR